MTETPTHEADLLLAEAAKMAFARAQHMHELCMAAEGVSEAAEASRASDHAMRAMRQNLVLLDRLQRNRAADAREKRAREEPRRLRRRNDLEQAVRRVICAEREDDAERHELFDELKGLIDPEYAPDGFIDKPLDAHVPDIAEQLGLSRETAARWYRLPEVIDVIEGYDDAEDEDEIEGDLDAVDRSEPEDCDTVAGPPDDTS